MAVMFSWPPATRSHEWNRSDLEKKKSIYFLRAEPRLFCLQRFKESFNYILKCTDCTDRFAFWDLKKSLTLFWSVPKLFLNHVGQNGLYSLYTSWISWSFLKPQKAKRPKQSVHLKIKLRNFKSQRAKRFALLNKVFWNHRRQNFLNSLCSLE